ncbi:MAG: HD domain-containing protein [Chitinophagaceae bacterium]
MSFRKIINDPVYGFITLDDPLIYSIISHPWYQRLRRINQMALSHLVYPGAVHSRLHHSLGAYHLMTLAIFELRSKGVEISPAEEQAAKIGILLHDIGHGPFSHALESIVIESLDHEALSLLIMEKMNQESDGKLSMAIDIFKGTYPKKFLHQLISGQLDVDRMDYLARDSFFTGVSEGTIGYDRILKMLTVHEGELMVEEKAIYSIEEFLVSRRLMYWQVYLHKTVISAEMMLVKIFERARWLQQHGNKEVVLEDTLSLFLFNLPEGSLKNHLNLFCQLDDTDVISAIKAWSLHKDKILSLLCMGVLNRKLFKLKLQADPIPAELYAQKKAEIGQLLKISAEDASFLVFTGKAENSLYNPYDERINILFRDGTIKDISLVDNALIHQNLSQPVKKFYICYYRGE